MKQFTHMAIEATGDTFRVVTRISRTTFGEQAQKAIGIRSPHVVEGLTKHKAEAVAAELDLCYEKKIAQKAR